MDICQQVQLFHVNEILKLDLNDKAPSSLLNRNCLMYITAIATVRCRIPADAKIQLYNYSFMGIDHGVN